MDYLNLFVNSFHNHLQFSAEKRSFKNEDKLKGSMAHFNEFCNKLEQQFNTDDQKFICITLCHCDKSFALSNHNTKLFKRLIQRIKEMDTKKPVIILLEHESMLDKRFYALIKDASQSICNYPFPPKETDKDEDLLKGSMELFKKVIIEASRRNVIDQTKFTMKDVDLMLKTQFR